MTSSSSRRRRTLPSRRSAGVLAAAAAAGAGIASTVSMWPDIGNRFARAVLGMVLLSLAVAIVSVLVMRPGRPR